MKKSQGANKWLELIGTGGEEKPPADFKTIEQVCKESGFGCTTVWKRLKPLIEAGKIERRDFRIKKGSKATPHYRIL